MRGGTVLCAAAALVTPPLSSPHSPPAALLSIEAFCGEVLSHFSLNGHCADGEEARERSAAEVLLFSYIGMDLFFPLSIPHASFSHIPFNRHRSDVYKKKKPSSSPWQRALRFFFFV
jgi:hypothetical protein